MHVQPDPIMAQLRLNRLAHLWGRLCLPDFSFEMSFYVGTRSDPRVPVFHLETMNLVLQPSDKLGGGKETPSACLPGGATPEVRFEKDKNTLSSEFET